MRTAAVAALALSVVAATGCGGVQTRAKSAERDWTISGLGIRAQLPPGWEGRIYPGPPRNLPVLQAANFPLPAGDTENGEVAQETIGTRGTYVNLTDEGSSSSTDSTVPVELARSDFGPPRREPGYLSHTGLYAYRDLVAAGHRRLLVVAAGRDDLNDAGLRQINSLLASIELKAPQRPAEPSAAAGPSMEGYGIRMRLDEGWRGRVSRGVFQAANFPLPADMIPGELGRNDLEVDQVYAALLEHSGDNSFVNSTFPIQLVPSEFVSPDPTAGFAGKAMTQRAFVVNGRYFLLRVEAGRSTPSDSALAGLNAALATLRVERGDFYPGRVEPATFAAAPGWHVGTSGAAEIEPDGEQTSTWATTIPYADPPFQYPPHKTLERLPADGIAILVNLSRSGPGPRYAERPLRLDRGAVTGPFEGTSADNALYRLMTSFKGEYEVWVSVFFGRAHPTSDELARAQAELDRLRLPDWGPWELETPEVSPPQ